MALEARGDAKHAAHLPQPLWLGEAPIAGKTILLHHEQGFGDTIQFARYAPLVAKLGARVILEVQPPLKSLLADIGDGVEVIGSGEAMPAFDLHCPLLSLPLAFRTELATIPADVPYLRAPAERIAQWSDRLPPRSGSARRPRLVGQRHAQGRPQPLDRARAACAAVRCRRASSSSACKRICARPMRNSWRRSRASPISAGISATSPTPPRRSRSVDLVISVDTSVAHLAGALGKPVWVLLPFCPDAGAFGVGVGAQDVDFGTRRTDAAVAVQLRAFVDHQGARFDGALQGTARADLDALGADDGALEPTQHDQGRGADGAVDVTGLADHQDVGPAHLAAQATIDPRRPAEAELTAHLRFPTQQRTQRLRRL